jgi:photosystem II stability/assembly factor-like uncharacterized protein
MIDKLTEGAGNSLIQSLGTTVTSLAVDPCDGEGGRIYAATPLGVFQSQDRGVTWQPPKPGLDGAPLTVLCLATGSENTSTLFGGNWNGIFRYDGRDSIWSQQLTETEVNTISASVDRDGATVVLAGTERDGLFVSMDLGYSFQSARVGLLDFTITTSTFSPAFATDQTIFVGTTSGIYKSRNAAKTWTLLNLPIPETVVQCIACSPMFRDDGVVLVGTESDGLFRSEDAGWNWLRVETQSEQSISDIVFANLTDRHLVLAADAQLLCSRDGGKSWEQSATLPAPVLSLSSERFGSMHVLFAGLLDLGVARSLDGSESWELTS